MEVKAVAVSASGWLGTMQASLDNCAFSACAEWLGLCLGEGSSTWLWVKMPVLISPDADSLRAACH